MTTLCWASTDISNISPSDSAVNQDNRVQVNLTKPRQHSPGKVRQSCAKTMKRHPGYINMYICIPPRTWALDLYKPGPSRTRGQPESKAYQAKPTNVKLSTQDTGIPFHQPRNQGVVTLVVLLTSSLVSQHCCSVETKTQRTKVDSESTSKLL